MITSPLLRALRTGVKSLLLHKLRSLLTTLGVLFGTGSVIAMLAIGEGASQEAQEQIRLLGSQNVILRSIKPQDDPNQGNQTSRVARYGLTDGDLARFEETFPGVESIVPIREIAKEVRFEDRLLHPRVLAVTPNYVQATGRLLWEGRFLTPEDDRTLQNVCVLGTEVARALFPFESALEKRVKIGSDYFTVVGTLAPRVRLGEDRAQPGTEITGEVFIPFGTARKWYGKMQVKMRSGSRDMEEVDLHEVILTVSHPENVRMVADGAREMLGRFHEKKQDYEVVVPLELLARAEETKRIFNIVLGSIAGISLLVGGIGIMNVMLATVTERTREIGIRRALGAKRRHIVTQFLVETICLSVGGGLFGVALGIAIPWGVERYADMKTVVTPEAPILAFGISAGVGIIFGLYPAWRAATMDPVEALRHE
ncbi:MAG TPA: ABC transporter permease [Planctomycetes bacterium]|nr:ABC transporter permease [Planctomycetota bacterium]